MIRLGVTPGFMYPDPDRVVYGPKTLCYIEREMAGYLARPRVMPVLIPDLGADKLMNFLDEIDGLVLQGGMDISPGTYGEVPIENDRWTGDPYRDEYELKILDHVIGDGKPVFGICRGCQLMNVYFGGTLYQDIRTQLPGALLHRDGVRYERLNHKISFVSGSLFERLHAGEKTLRVNSIHHQGIKTPGKDLAVQAFSEKDRIVEAFIWNNAPPGKVVGVQWHPEFFRGSEERLIDPNIVYDHFLSFFEI